VYPYNNLQEKVARGILNASIHQDLIYDLLTLKTSSEVYFHILSKFRSINCTSQLQAWRNFISIDPSKYSTTATILSAFNDALRAFKETVI
jgi:hypothetical protein